MAGYAKKTVDAAKRLVDDPMYKVERDGTVWKQMGLPDASGNQVVSYQVGAGDYITVTTRLLVFLKYGGQEVPEGSLVTVLDGNTMNNAIDNLVLQKKQTVKPKRLLTGADITKIKEMYTGGMSPLEIAQELQITVGMVKQTLFNGNNGS